MTTGHVFATLPAKIINRTADLTGATPVYVALLSNLWTPNAALSVFADLTGEPVGAGYTAGGMVLDGLAPAGVPGGTGLKRAGNLTWPGLSVVFRYAVAYLGGPGALGQHLVCWWDFITDQNPAGVNTNLVPDATGFFALASADVGTAPPAGSTGAG